MTQEASLIQYGKYKYAKTLSDMSGKPVDHIQSGVIYLAETRETQRIETEKYSGAAFFSDIGGHAGLILGIRFNTVNNYILNYFQCHYTTRYNRLYNDKVMVLVSS